MSPPPPSSTDTCGGCAGSVPSAGSHASVMSASAVVASCDPAVDAPDVAASVARGANDGAKLEPVVALGAPSEPTIGDMATWRDAVVVLLPGAPFVLVLVPAGAVESSADPQGRVSEAWLAPTTWLPLGCASPGAPAEPSDSVSIGISMSPMNMNASSSS